MKTQNLEKNSVQGRKWPRGILGLLAACAASALLSVACEVVGIENSVAPSASLGYSSGVITTFATPPAGSLEIVANYTKPANDSSPLYYTATALSSSDLPLTSVTVTLTPVQTLGNGAKIPASVSIRVTDLNEVIDGNYAPRSAVYVLDYSKGFTEANYSVGAGPGKLTIDWRTDPLNACVAVSELSDFGLRQNKVTSFSLVAQKY